MKLAYIYPEELPSKKARTISVINSASEIAKITNCTLFIPTSSKSNDEIFDFYNIKNPQLTIKRIQKSFLSLKSNKIFNRNLYKAIQKEKIDIVYVRHLKSAKYLLSKKNRKFKIIFECHEIFYKTLEEESKNRKKIENLKILEEFVYASVDILIFVNKNLQKYFNNVFKSLQPKQSIVYNGMKFDEAYIKKDFKNIGEIFYIGNFFKWKGLEDAIKTLSFFPNLNLNIIGGDNEQRTQELKNLAKKLNIEKNISFLGFKNSNEVKKILSKEAKITIIPNTKSIQNDFSMPIKLFEYMATSNVVIASNMITIQEIIIDEKNGFLFESGNIEDFKRVLQKVISLKHNTLQDIAKNAYETSKNYTWTKRAEKIVKLSKELK